jgi:hypothetical protein
MREIKKILARPRANRCLPYSPSRREHPTPETQFPRRPLPGSSVNRGALRLLAN